MDELKKQIGNRLNKIVQYNQMSQLEVKNKLEEAGHKEISQPTIKRYLSGDTEQNASFILSFCRAFHVSADDVLGLDTDAIHSETVTPLIVLRNLFLLLNQFDFNIEFDTDNQKAMITTDNEFMINFLIAKKTLKNLTLDQIDRFCETYQLRMIGKKLVTKEQYYAHYKQLYIEKELAEDRSAEQEGIDSMILEEDTKLRISKIDKILVNEDFTRKGLFSMEWDSFSEKDKDAHIKEMEEAKKTQDKN